MSSNFGYIDRILLAMIAGFIILRLRSILGRKTGHEDKIYPGFSEKKFEEFQKKQEVKFKKTNPNDLVGEEKEKFIKGAEIAYETIITAFAKGDKKTLNSLLTSEMSNNFDRAISERENKGIKSELTFIGMKKSSLEKYEKSQNNIFADQELNLVLPHHMHTNPSIYQKVLIDAYSFLQLHESKIP